MNDWMTSMGAVALLRLDEDKQEIHAKANTLEVPIEWLKHLPETLFQYFLKHYSVADREYQALQNLVNIYIRNLEKEESKLKENIKWINERVKSTCDKVKKYFPDLDAELINCMSNIKIAMESKDTRKLEDQIGRLYQIYKQQKIDQKLTLNWVKATLLSSAAGQASFLNVAKNALSFKEQKSLFERDYILPVLWELRLREKFEKGDEEEIEALFKIGEKPEYAKSWASEKKKSKLSWYEWLKTVPECGLIENQWGTASFEEMHFVPLGMSVSNAYNYAWDGNLQAVQSISALAKLLLLLSPLGTYRYRRPSKGELVNVFGFLHAESSCQKTFMLNNQFSNSMRTDTRFSEAIRDSFGKLKEIENRRNEVTVLIEWDTDYKAKKTFLEYKSLNPNFVDYIISTKENVIEKISPYQFREEIIRAAFDNLDCKNLIMKEMHRIMNLPTTNRDTFSLKNALIMREHLLMLKEEKNLLTEKTVTEKMYALGFRIAQTLGGKKEEATDTLYQAPNEKKLTSTAYRLLNAAKAGNRELFFDTVVRLHLAANMNVGKNLVKAVDLNTSDKEFTSIALAFIAGLTPGKKQIIEETEVKL
ncbi:hypothetical protein CD30_00860 [Ureibacillus massiliensis 4400831 = CIP 108448 = CCUG 49529]|uniref:Uncharacterized protein n=1 Tax=Ureibacillus massiliensis 4400831 = CIP 108448 = CCUG 49529 TaxID=1211035 RepID=A0A0A3J5U2_9BACL|nr:hypothetical protein CD30_00860 [Ureibacillus massiliensis 4400831 = CIP 108448 = CCUG 49529]